MDQFFITHVLTAILREELLTISNCHSPKMG